MAIFQRYIDRHMDRHSAMCICVLYTIQQQQQPPNSSFYPTSARAILSLIRPLIRARRERLAILANKDLKVCCSRSGSIAPHNITHGSRSGGSISLEIYRVIIWLQSLACVASAAGRARRSASATMYRLYVCIGTHKSCWCWKLKHTHTHTRWLICVWLNKIDCAAYLSLLSLCVHRLYYCWTQQLRLYLWRSIYS